MYVRVRMYRGWREDGQQLCEVVKVFFFSFSWGVRVLLQRFSDGSLDVVSGLLVLPSSREVKRSEFPDVIRKVLLSRFHNSQHQLKRPKSAKIIFSPLFWVFNWNSWERGKIGHQKGVWGKVEREILRRQKREGWGLLLRKMWRRVCRRCRRRDRRRTSERWG